MTCERFEFPGGVATICSRGRRTKPVPPCACGNPATHACDYSLGSRKTCSRSLCERCRVQMDKGKDFCPAHAEMDRNQHRCHARGCSVPVPKEKLLCLKHWRLVPKTLQHEVWRHYRPGQCDDMNPSKEWHKAADAAIAAVTEHESRHRVQGSLF